MMLKNSVLLLIAFVSCASAYAQGLQRPDEIQQLDQDWRRGDIESQFDYDHRTVREFDKPELRLKWAIVSGEFGGTVDRVRGRFLFNDEKWIDLHAKKNVAGNYENGVVRIRQADQLTAGEALFPIANSDSSNEQDEVGEADTSTSGLSELRIVEWSHDKLIVKFTYETQKQELPIYFRFDLSRNPDQ